MHQVLHMETAMYNEKNERLNHLVGSISLDIKDSTGYISWAGYIQKLQ